MQPPPSFPRPPPLPTNFGYPGYGSVPPVAPPSMPPRKKTSVGMFALVAVLGAAGVVGMLTMGALAFYGVKRYVQNSRMAAAKIASAKHVPRAEGRTYRDDDGFSITFPAAPNASSHEEHDGEVRVSMATLETGPTQFGAGKTELFGANRYECREVLAKMQTEMLNAVKCKPTHGTPSREGKELDFALACENGIQGLGRLTCDPSELETAMHGVVYSALYYAVPKAYSEAEGRAFLDSMKTR